MKRNSVRVRTRSIPESPKRAPHFRTKWLRQSIELWMDQSLVGRLPARLSAAPEVLDLARLAGELLLSAVHASKLCLQRHVCFPHISPNTARLRNRLCTVESEHGRSTANGPQGPSLGPLEELPTHSIIDNSEVQQA